MKIGTKSVLFGAHCFFIHSFFVFIAWWKLYGFPWDPRLWVAFVVHDLGYWGKPNMDGPEGETHVELGANILSFLFDKKYKSIWYYWSIIFTKRKMDGPASFNWYQFSLYHSRFYAKKYNAQSSKLCFADKLAMCYEPDWFYLFRINLSGEIDEYMNLAVTRNLAGEQQNKYEQSKLSTNSQKDWRKACVSYVTRWVEEHKDGSEDTWTPSAKQSINESGVWQ